MSETTTSTGRPATSALELLQHRVLAEIALDEGHAFDRLHRQDVQRDDRAVELRRPPRRRRRPPCGANLRRTYWLQAPGTAPRSTTTGPGG